LYADVRETVLPNESIPKAILHFSPSRSVAERVIMERHLPLIMIRGENIVTVSCVL
jgi:hypothetical protein